MWQEREVIYPKEAFPAEVGKIVARFRIGDEVGGERSMADESGFSPLQVAVSRATGAEEFRRVNAPEDCPCYGQVLAGALFCGLGSDEIERFGEVLCGRVVEQEDTMGWAGPLSGRRGEDCQPKSQCWRSTIELARLVKFMREREEKPDFPEASVSEGELLAVLEKRRAIKARNKARQDVFVVWTKLREGVWPWFKEGGENLKLMSRISEDNQRVGDGAAVFDGAAQLNVGGAGYQELTDWVEREVLDPLIEIVGDNNIRMHLGAKDMKLSYQETAENCLRKPHSGFRGTIS